MLKSKVHARSGYALMMGALLACTTTGCRDQTVWLLMFDSTSEPDCERGVLHNFTGGTAIDIDNYEWETISVVQRGSDIAFAQLIEAGRGVGVLVLGDQAFPGERTGNDWVFDWTDVVGTADGQQHSSGYGYFEYTKFSTEWTIKIDTERGETSGEMEQADLQELTWRESDTWADSAAATIGYNGQMPAGSYVLVDDGETGESGPASNRADTSDCDTTADAPWCEVQDITICETSRDFTATKTRLEDGNAYGGLGDVSGAAE
jgi:hypothetical protein